METAAGLISIICQCSSTAMIAFGLFLNPASRYECLFTTIFLETYSQYHVKRRYVEGCRHPLLTLNADGGYRHLQCCCCSRYHSRLLRVTGHDPLPGLRRPSVCAR